MWDSYVARELIYLLTIFLGYFYKVVIPGNNFYGAYKAAGEVL